MAAGTTRNRRWASIRRPITDDTRGVFLLDVDNTLLGNERIIVDLRRHPESESGVANSDRYRAIFEGPSEELGYADYLGPLQRQQET